MAPKLVSLQEAGPSLRQKQLSLPRLVGKLNARNACFVRLEHSLHKGGKTRILSLHEGKGRKEGGDVKSNAEALF